MRNGGRFNLMTYLYFKVYFRHYILNFQNALITHLKIKILIFFAKNCFNLLHFQDTLELKKINLNLFLIIKYFNFIVILLHEGTSRAIQSFTH